MKNFILGVLVGFFVFPAVAYFTLWALFSLGWVS